MRVVIQLLNRLWIVSWWLTTGYLQEIEQLINLNPEL